MQLVAHTLKGGHLHVIDSMSALQTRLKEANSTNPDQTATVHVLWEQSDQGAI